MKKLLLLGVLLLSIVGLASCTQEDPTELILINAPTQMIYSESEFNSTGVVFRGDEGVQLIKVKASGVVEMVNYEGAFINPSATVGVLTYGIIENNTQYNFSIYVRPDDIDSTNDEIVLINFMYSSENARNPIGASQDLEGFEAHIIRANSETAEVISGEALLPYLSTTYVALTEEGFFENDRYTVNFEYEGFTASYEVYVGGGERPIHNEDASILEWIFVIPVAFITQFFAGLFGNSLALGILFATLIVRTLGWPIYAKSNDLSLKMNLAQPEMQRIQAKYATRKDPQSQQQQQMETMQVYKKYGINAFGCLMPFLQMPIFIAMYNVVRRISLEGGMYADQVLNTKFLGIDLANTNDGVIGIILAGIVGLTMFAIQTLAMKKPEYVKNTGTQNLSPQAQQSQKTMKYVSYFMIIMMMTLSYQSNALAVYWVFGNLYSLVQTLVNRNLSAKKHEKMKEKELYGGLVDAKKN
jgi:YidC/Oxa1 family membrane protein insertase